MGRENKSIDLKPKILVHLHVVLQNLFNCLRFLRSDL